MVAVGFVHLAQPVRGAIWAVALAVMGIACLANALRCHRLHCYLTGPFFLIMAAVSLSYGLGIVHVGNAGWNLIAGIIIAGALVLTYLPEAFLGKYRTTLPG